MRYGWGRYVSVAEKHAIAAREMRKRRKSGLEVSPIAPTRRRTIASTFWGRSWCDNLERYSDYANRLPRGRTYARNGSVVHLEIHRGRVEAFVAGSRLYTVSIGITALPADRWHAICQDCSGGIDSLVELLQGELSKGVMERLYRQRTGLFPSPAEIKLSCSCPDWAVMCKHVAAVLYGVGVRLDDQPELLFRLRDVDETELLAQASADLPLEMGAETGRVLEADDLSGLFGLDMDPESAGDPATEDEDPESTGDPATEDEGLCEAIAAVEARAATLRRRNDRTSRMVLAELEKWLETHGVR